MQKHTYILSKEMNRKATLNTRRLKRKIGKRLLDKRIKMGMTHSQLSRRTGLSPHTIDCFELGKSNYNWRNLVILMMALGMDVKNQFIPQSESP